MLIVLGREYAGVNTAEIEQGFFVPENDFLYLRLLRKKIS